MSLFGWRRLTGNQNGSEKKQQEINVSSCHLEAKSTTLKEGDCSEA
jgi:hypothetical protein